MSEYKHNVDEQLDAALGAVVQGEQPASVWKVELIETMEKKTERIKKRKIRWWLVLPTAAVPFVGFFAFMYAQNVVSYTASPFYTPSAWEYEHVSYEAAEGFELPFPITDIRKEAGKLHRNTFDGIAEHINPELLGSIEEDNRELLYSAGDEHFGVYDDEDNLLGFEWQPKAWPTTKKGKIKYPLDDMSCAENAAAIENLLETVLSPLVADFPIVVDTTEYGGSSCDVSYAVDERTQVEAFEFMYDGQELVVVRGSVIQDIVFEDTTVYGTLDQILEDLNAYPVFPLRGPEPDIDIVYEVTDYRISEHGLELYTQMRNVDAIYEAFGFTEDIDAPLSFANEYSGSWHSIDTKKNRKKFLEEYESYMKGLEIE